MSELEKISGEILDLRLFGAWGLGRVVCADAVHTICGKALVGLVLDDARPDRNKYELTGVWKKHPKYGEQFEVTGLVADVDPTRDALIKFLVLHFQGCGVRTADEIVEWYTLNGGLGVLRDILIRNPESLPHQVPLGKRKKPLMFQDDSGATAETQIYRRLAVQLGGRGVADPVLRRLASFLYGRVASGEPAQAGVVEAAWQRLRDDPYAPIRFCQGFGFQTAEQIASFFEFPKDAPERLGAIAYHALDESCKGRGHAYLTRAEFAAEVANMDSTAPLERSVQYATQQGLPVVEDNGRYYLGEILAAERHVAHRLSLMVRPTHAPIYVENDAFLRHAIRVAEQSIGPNFKLDPSQRAAMIKLLTSGCLLHTLTAGPGCGKTAIMELICSVADKVSICFLAPTGKAAKVLHNRIQRYNREAMTIHRALEPAGDGYFTKNENNPLPYRVVVVDEASMVDLPLLADLLAACKDDTHLVLIGDEDQLPSVGPGRILEDICLLPGDHNRLTTTHRNKGGILDLVRMVREGSIRDLGCEDVRFEGDMGEPEQGFDARVLPVYRAAVARAGIANVCLVLARRKGRRDVPGWNATYANGRLQEVLNPEQELPHGPRRITIDEVGVKVPDAGYLRIGDRVMVRKNLLLPQDPNQATTTAAGVDEDEDRPPPQFDPVVNGDTGTIQRATMNAAGALRYLSLELDDGRTVFFPGPDIDFLALSYATTVHAAQGSEYSEVILVLTTGHPDFVHRKIVYTAASRPKERLTIFGAPAVLTTLVRRPGPERNSGLIARVKLAAPDLDYAGAAAARSAVVAPPVAMAGTSIKGDPFEVETPRGPSLHTLFEPAAPSAATAAA